MPPLLGAQSPNHCTTGEAPLSLLIIRDNFFSDHILVLGPLYTFKLLRVLKSFLSHIQGLSYGQDRKDI